MKKFEIFYLENCPYCRKAFKYIDELKSQFPQFKKIEMTIIEESRQKQTADARDYYYVPTFYVDGKKVFEGACDKKDVENILKSVIETAVERQ